MSQELPYILQSAQYAWFNIFVVAEDFFAWFRMVPGSTPNCIPWARVGQEDLFRLQEAPGGTMYARQKGYSD
jgi:hypothetical protein